MLPANGAVRFNNQQEAEAISRRCAPGADGMMKDGPCDNMTLLRSGDSRRRKQGGVRWIVAVLLIVISHVGHVAVQRLSEKDPTGGRADKWMIV